MHRGQTRQVALRPVDISGALSSLGTTLVQRHPVKLSLNFLGLALLFLLPGLTPSDSQYSAFEALQPSRSDLSAEHRAREARDASHRSYRQSQGWFWTCDAVCSRNKAAYEQDLRAWQAAHGVVEAQLIEANSKLGIFSANAVEQTKDLFWSTFAQGMAYVRELCALPAQAQFASLTICPIPSFSRRPSARASGTCSLWAFARP